MYSVTSPAKTKLKMMNSILDYIDAQLLSLPEGTLKCHKKYGQIYYSVLYREKDMKPVERHIKAEDSILAAKLAQARYYRKMRTVILNNIKALEKTAAKPSLSFPDSAELFKGNIASLVSPICFSVNGRPMLWSDYDPPRNPYHRESYVYQSKSGYMVRSKSEMIIADYLYDNGIPFRSDAALKLPRSQKVVYPDFTILRISDGALIFLEHFGMMDEPEYLDGFFEKKLLYNNEGLYEGKNLIFTFEDRLHPLNIRQIEGSIRAILTA